MRILTSALKLAHSIHHYEAVFGCWAIKNKCMICIRNIFKINASVKFFSGILTIVAFIRPNKFAFIVREKKQA